MLSWHHIYYTIRFLQMSPKVISVVALVVSGSKQDPSVSLVVPFLESLLICSSPLPFFSPSADDLLQKPSLFFRMLSLWICLSAFFGVMFNLLFYSFPSSKWEMSTGLIQFWFTCFARKLYRKDDMPSYSILFWSTQHLLFSLLRMLTLSVGLGGNKWSFHWTAPSHSFIKCLYPLVTVTWDYKMVIF